MRMSHRTSLGLLALLLPVVATAQCPQSDIARDLLGQDPIGHYTKAVLDRVDEGINNAKASEKNSSAINLNSYYYLAMIESFMYMMVDTDLRAVEYSRDLTSITPCLHLDLAMLEAKIEEVRCEVNEAYEAASPGALRQLVFIADFLNDRYQNLIRGALEPDHVDPFWALYYEFDDPFEGWCCVLDQLECQIMESDECTEVHDGTGGYDFYDTKDGCSLESTCVFAADGETDPKYTDMCPFDSDYMADNNTGYGCQIELLERFSGSNFEAVSAEADALTELKETRDDFLDDIEHIKDTTQSMDDLTDNTMLNEDELDHLQDFGEVEEIEHRRVFGCNADLPPEERDNDDGVEGELTPEIKPSEEWGSLTTRGPFFFRKNHLDIWKKFFRLQHEWAEQREYPKYLRNPDEFPEEDEREEAVESDNNAFGLLVFPRNGYRDDWRYYSHVQATQESALIIKAQDAELEVLEALEPVRPAVKKNIETVNQQSRGLRKFARNYAYYLRRSCVYRPCNEKLETIMKVLFSDECFPYASGAFEDNLEPNPEHEECMENVGDPSYCDAQFDKYLGDPHWEKCQEEVEKL